MLDPRTDSHPGGKYLRQLAQSHLRLDVVDETLSTSHDSTVGFPYTRCRLVSARKIIYNAIYLDLFLARSLSSVYRRYNKYLFFAGVAFSPLTLDPFFSTDSLAPTIRTFSPAFPSPPPPSNVQSPCLFISRSELFVNRTRLIYVSPWRFVYQIIQLIGKQWRPLFFAEPLHFKRNKYFHRKHF